LSIENGKISTKYVKKRTKRYGNQVQCISMTSLTYL